jgi:hypothetical protein
MKIRSLFLVGLLLLPLLAACARPPVVLDRVLVRNLTPGFITEVDVRHEPTLRFGSVNVILPGKSLEIAFAKGRMLATRAVVNWRDEAGKPWSVALALPDGSGVADTGRALTLVYSIHPAGEVTVQLEPTP